jgi:hypothetical protein
VCANEVGGGRLAACPTRRPLPAAMTSQRRRFHSGAQLPAVGDWRSLRTPPQAYARTTSAVPARFTLLHLSGEDDLALDPAPRHESQPPGEAERSLFFGSISRVATVHCVSGPRRSSRSSTAREAYPFPLAAGKPPEELLVPSFDKQLRVARTRWLERDPRRRLPFGARTQPSRCIRISERIASRALG